ncbi:VOC family protein [Spirosoma sp. KNUC1025]|uniref:VOC family protein n=1 Tax=Spirosoma sp. KNUC1025 TaxID=2894082 RepID=UPI003868EF47|nr:VOC family protein [Spirosoma sp. KNUC1025]
MKLNAGIITDQLAETKAFYCNVLNFGVTFENDFYLLLHTPNHQAELSFLLPNHPSQQPLFQSAFTGKGVFLTIEVPDVDEEYNRIKTTGVPVAVELRDEPWGDRHFSVIDPNGIGIDLVTYAPPPSV